MWNYIYNQKDLEEFMDCNRGFHHSSLLECRYITKRYAQIGMEDKDYRGVFRIIFQSQERFCNTLELTFEDVIEVSLKPCSIENLRNSPGSIVIMDDDGITWFDSSLYEEDYELLYSNPEVTWVKAKKLKWRQNSKEDSNQLI